MIGELAGLALDARFAMRHVAPGRRAPRARAIAARWIAANALAAGGVAFTTACRSPRQPQVFSLRAPCLAAALAAIAAIPVLVDAATLPQRWRVALRALGLPTLDRSRQAALAEGASVLAADGLGACELQVERGARGYHVRVGSPGLMLVA